MDLTVKYGRIREASRLDLTGAEVTEILVPIHIGAHGPFSERFTREEYAGGLELPRRVELLKQQIRGLPQ